MHLYAYLYLLQWAQLHTCDKDLDWLICLGLLLALADSLQNMADHFVFQAASKPAFEEANMHQRAAAQPGCALIGGCAILQACTMPQQVAIQPVTRD